MPHPQPKSVSALQLSFMIPGCRCFVLPLALEQEDEQRKMSLYKPLLIASAAGSIGALYAFNATVQNKETLQKHELNLSMW